MSSNLKYLLWSLIGFLIVAALSYAAFLLIYQGKVYPGVSIGQIEIGGRTAVEAEKILDSELEKVSQSGFNFRYQNKKVNVMPELAAFDPDLASTFFSYNRDTTLNKAFYYGRGSNAWENFKNQIGALMSGHSENLDYELDDEPIKNFLREAYKSFETFGSNASLVANTSTPEISFTIAAEKVGEEIDYDSALLELRNNLDRVHLDTVILERKVTYPGILKSQSEGAISRAQELIKKSTPLTLEYKSSKTSPTSTLIVTGKDVASWLDLENIESNVDVHFDSVRIEEFIKGKLGKSIDQKPVKASIEVKDGKAVNFKFNEDGWELDMENSINNITKALENGSNQKAQLVFKLIASEGDNSLSELGIKEIIGTGHSNFAGSPSNRRHNIKVGADTLNGILIKPGEEFSLIKALGNIDASSGYLTELVIKENKTVPEYGGGLCQIGTTVFRTVVDSGLPVTMRRNHSYRVVYYEPAGTDATIYNPWPDFRFINDTGNHILIQSRFEGTNDVYFDFWGTNDGRLVTSTKPVIYNIVKPQPTKIVETTELPVGKKKCTESSHNGADAYFDYKVTYPATSSDPITKEVRFKSHYVPWQAVCLVGVEKISSSTPEAVVPPTQ